MKKITSLLLTMLLICTMMSVAAVPAFAEETPETDSETMKENETLIKTATELQTYINGLPSGAAGTIKLAEMMTIDEEIEINKPCSLTFENKTTFHLKINERAFYINSNAVKLNFPNGSTFDGGKTNECIDGKGIYIKGNDCEIYGATFDKCVGDTGGKLRCYAGGIYVDGDNCKISNCVFTKCGSDENGGAIALCGEKNTVSNCTFTDCSCDNGGAIAILEENNTVSDCDFENCRSESGGGIYIRYDDSKIINCRFKLCQSPNGDGGAVYLGVDVDDIEIRDCTFDECTAADSGGAIYSNNYSVRTKITNCTFNKCQATKVDGGAISIGFDCDDVTITDSTFTACDAGHDGGAINICQQSDDIKIESSTFDGCHALDGRGGAIFVGYGAARCNIVKCDFSNCSADGDGDYVLGDDDTVIKNCTPKTEDEELFDDCEFEFSATGSVLSEGSIWIIIVVAVVAVGGVAALFIVKKKKKPALADGTEKEDEE